MTLTELIKSYGIPESGGIPFSACRVRKQYLIDRLGFVPQSAYIFIIPYYSRACDDRTRNVSSYAVARDYHIFIEETGKEIVSAAEKLFPGHRFAVFGDRSPIDERDAAARAGLGIIGDNGLLITPAYSSFVFISEILTDMEPDTEPGPVMNCEGCGRCRSACPARGDMSLCLSAVTQNKGELTPAEEQMIRSNGTLWGCDICQSVCPHTQSAKRRGTIYSPIPFFNENTLPCVTWETLSDEADFASRAYSWRGPGPIMRNYKLLSLNEDKK